MSETEDFLILVAQIAATIGAKKAAALCPHNVARRKLADISNLPQNQRLLIQEKPPSIDKTTKDYIDQLQKENMALMKMLSHRNKIIEQSGIKLDGLRVTLLKVEEQNQQLALSNTQMLAELHSGKDRLKLLQHELGCKSGLLRASKLELEGVRNKTCRNADAKSQEEGKPLKEGTDAEKPHKAKRNLESNDLGSSEQDQTKDKPENRRPSKRRQSTRFKAAEIRPDEDFFQTNNTEASANQLHDNRVHTGNKRSFARRQSARFKAAEVKRSDDTTEINGSEVSEPQLPDDTMQEHGSTTESALEKNENNTVISAPKSEPQEFGRPSVSRPSRVAAKRVQSYKEMPVNVKMRRPE